PRPPRYRGLPRAPHREALLFSIFLQLRSMTAFRPEGIPVALSRAQICELSPARLWLPDPQCHLNLAGNQLPVFWRQSDVSDRARRARAVSNSNDESRSGV